jgi:hypothetical protein
MRTDGFIPIMSRHRRVTPKLVNAVTSDKPFNILASKFTDLVHPEDQPCSGEIIGINRQMEYVVLKWRSLHTIKESVLYKIKWSYSWLDITLETNRPFWIAIKQNWRCVWTLKGWKHSSWRKYFLDWSQKKLCSIHIQKTELQSWTLLISLIRWFRIKRSQK